jgi:hypothetical protein
LLGQTRAGEALVDADDDLFGKRATRVDADHAPELDAQAVQIEVGDPQLALEGDGERIGAGELAGDALVIQQCAILIAAGEVRIAAEQQRLWHHAPARIGVPLEPLIEHRDGGVIAAAGKTLSRQHQVGIALDRGLRFGEHPAAVDQLIGLGLRQCATRPANEPSDERATRTQRRDSA